MVARSSGSMAFEEGGSRIDDLKLVSLMLQTPSREVADDSKHRFLAAWLRLPRCSMLTASPFVS